MHADSQIPDQPVVHSSVSFPMGAASLAMLMSPGSRMETRYSARQFCAASSRLPGHYGRTGTGTGIFPVRTLGS